MEKRSCSVKMQQYLRTECSIVAVKHMLETHVVEEVKDGRGEKVDEEEDEEEVVGRRRHCREMQENRCLQKRSLGVCVQSVAFRVITS